MSDVVEGKCVRLPWGEWAIQLTRELEIGKRMHINAHYDVNRTKHFDCRVVTANDGKSLAEILRPDGSYFDWADGTRVVCWSYSASADWIDKITGVNVLADNGEVSVHRTRIIAIANAFHYTPPVDLVDLVVAARIVDTGTPIVRPASARLISRFAAVHKPAFGIDHVSAVAAKLRIGNTLRQPSGATPTLDRFRKSVSNAQIGSRDDDYEEPDMLEYWQAHQEPQNERAEWVADWFRYISDDGFEDGLDDDPLYVSSYRWFRGWH